MEFLRGINPKKVIRSVRPIALASLVLGGVACTPQPEAPLIRVNIGDFISNPCNNQDAIVSVRGFASFWQVVWHRTGLLRRSIHDNRLLLSGVEATYVHKIAASKDSPRYAPIFVFDNTEHRDWPPTVNGIKFNAEVSATGTIKSGLIRENQTGKSLCGLGASSLTFVSSG